MTEAQTTKRERLGGATVILHDVLYAYVAEAPDWVSLRKVAP